MKEPKSPQELENQIGYKFRDSKILEDALTRKQSRNDKQNLDNDCMDPLATLGDAVLDLVVISKLYEDGERNKGKLTEIKTQKVRREKTRTFAEKNELEKYIRWGKGEDQDKIWDKSNRALDTVTEALIGAVFLDAQKRELNGLNIVLKMLERMNFFDS